MITQETIDEIKNFIMTPNQRKQIFVNELESLITKHNVKLEYAEFKGFGVTFNLETF